ncbi:hypothetical protein HYPSUDRAFT_209211 [Hypholoma sublateritium FD-334 SS-4]|uniref:Uncharacterized protein n=1 Tax=Hypholoma sublateritium (strain FD-334 SS-4) TaxID=945553 RepID=A0A0D2N3K2_HYPSF|nr:hypothetical protein HYPSUDRAFT_209211 [Hypholoma sublateritium FD-334 SS-4]
MQTPSSNAATDEFIDTRHMPGAWIEAPVPSPPAVNFTGTTEMTHSADLLELSDVSPTVPLTSLQPAVLTTTSSQASVRERSPSAQQSENSQADAVASENIFWAPDEPPLSLAAHLSQITTEVMTLGDEGLAAYQGMLSRLEHLQTGFSRLFRANIIPVGDGEESPSQEIELAVSDPSLTNPFSAFPETIIAEYFCIASDIRSALSLRQSVNLVQIGHLLAELAGKLRLHDEDASILGRIEREIQFMQEIDKQRNLCIRFESLQYYRSTFSPSRGESFSEKHRFLGSHVEEYLEDNVNATGAAAQFLIDPTSLKEHRLSQFF